MERLALGLVFAVYALLTPIPVATQSPGQATVEGVVRADSGEPLVGAEVRLSGPRNLAPAQTQTTPPLRATKTNGNGEFSFENLESGSYDLTASARGFDRRSYGQESRTSLGMRISLVGNQRIANVKIQLPRLGAISGGVFSEDSREPIPNVPVDLLLRNGFEGEATQVRSVMSTTTDDRGEYRLYSIPPGRYYLSVGTAGTAPVYGSLSQSNDTDSRVPQSFALRFFPGVGTVAEAAPVNVGPGPELRIDMTTYRKPTYTIRGFVEDGATGRPPSRVQLQLNDRTFPSLTYSPDTGAFEIRNVAVGSYTLFAQSRVQDDVTRSLKVDDVFVMSPTARAPIQISDSDVADVKLRLWRPESVSGRVRMDRVAGNPPRGVSLHVIPIDTTARIPTAFAGDDGTFRVYGLLEGSYRAWASVPLGFHVKSIQYGLADILNGPWRFSGTPADSDVIEIVLGEGSAQVTGTVTDPLSQPVGGAQVVLVPEPSWRTDLMSRGSGSTDQYGRFSLANVPPGDYKLFAWAASEEVDPSNPEYIRRFEPFGRLVRISASSPIHLDIRVIPKPGN